MHSQSKQSECARIAIAAPPETCWLCWRCSRPTLFLSECVLVYLEPQPAQQVLAWAAGACSAAGGAVAVYEQVSWPQGWRGVPGGGGLHTCSAPG
jgi:hypothetical protein